MPEPSRPQNPEETAELKEDPEATTTLPSSETQDSLRTGGLETTRDGSAITRPELGKVTAKTVRRGEFAVVKVHAQGGLGRVSVARDERIGRRVALKEIRGDRLSPEAEHRFVTEAEITGQLEHPGIVPVYAMDQDDQGRPFYVMRFIEGEPLSKAIAACHGDAAEGSIAELIPRFLDVCQALAYAHSKQIIHRDLKPANVMLGAYGETLVVDWGLAKRLDSDDAQPDTGPGLIRPTAALATMDGAVLGTPSYMAPEQARGEITTMDARADVFGLGGILCAIITGTPPLQGDNVQHIMERAERGELAPTFERLDGAECDAELKQIAKRCLAPQPSDRFADGGEVATAVVAYQAGVQERLRQAELERVAAQTKAAEERKRRRVMAGLFAAVAGVLLLLAVLALSYRHQQQQFAADLRSAWGQTRQRVAESYQYTGDAFQMRTTLDVGETAFQSAADRLAGRATGETLEQEQAQVRRDLDAAFADLQVLEALDQFEQNSTQVDVERSRYDNEGAVRQLIEELRLYFGDGSPNDHAERLRSRPPAMRDRLREILFVGFSEAGQTSQTELVQWLEPIIRAVDQHPWRAQVLEAMSASDRESLADLSQQVAPEEHSAMFLASLADWLPDGAGAQKEVFLRRLQSLHPAHFWINHALAKVHEDRLPEFEEAISAERIGDAREAVRFYTAATVARPKNAGICLNLGLILEQLGRGEEAVTLYRRSASLRPDYYAAFENLGLALRDQGQPDQAIAAYAEAARLKPSAYRWAKLGELMLDHNRGDDGIECYRKGIAVARQQGEGQGIAHFELASALVRVRAYDEADGEFRRGLEFDPTNRTAIYNHGDLQSRRGDLDAAIESFEWLVDRDAEDYNAWIALALARLRGGRSADGIDALERATRLRKEEPLAWQNLGYAYLNVNNFTRSAQVYRQAIALNPRDAHSMAFLGEALKRQGRLRDALAEYQRAEANKQHWEGYNLPTADWIRDTGMTVEFYDRLPLTAEQLAGETITVEELLVAAWQAFRDAKWEIAADLIAFAYQRDSDLVETPQTGVRTMAAQAYVCAASQQDADPKTSTERLAQALRWMESERQWWASPDLDPAYRARAAETLSGWQTDEHFAKVRGDTQTEWVDFWLRVERSAVAAQNAKP